MRDVTIHVERLGKRYRIGQRRGVLSRGLARFGSGRLGRRWGWRRLDPPSAPEETIISALRDVSFDVGRGEVMGVIGPNGAGKSTLLKILSRITEPSEGYAEIHGRVGSLLEVGTGFHAELSGRENVFLNGAILGMKRREIRRRFDRIVEFAGVARFIDTPVKHYSSGMYVRLAFAVAAELQTEVLMVDEVLAVGDAAFQLKCLNRMSEIAGGGRTVLFVSHNMEAVAALCSRALLLEEGSVVRVGTPQECIEEYLSRARRQREEDAGPISLVAHPGRTKDHNGPVRLVSVAIVGNDGKPSGSVRSGEDVSVVLGYQLLDASALHSLTFAVTLSGMYGHRISSCRSHDTYAEPIRPAKRGEVVCRIRRLPLVPGSYKVSLGCATEAGFSDGIYDAAVVEVAGGDFYQSKSFPPRAHGEVLLDHQWEVL